MTWRPMSNRIEILHERFPVIAIVGRPNVGKSALFNRIVGRRKAVVLEVPGLTRDRNFETAEWGGRQFVVVDTGGYEVEGVETGAGPLKTEMREQAMLAIEEADAVILLTDAREGVTPLDEEVLAILRRSKKPMLLAANKCDNPGQENLASDFYRLGVEEVFAVSALHGTGVADLLDAVLERLPAAPVASDGAETGIRIAVVGRQNVGKSTLVNALLGQQRVITADLPGTTRDAIDTTFRRGDQVYTLIDTAGIRRRGKIERGIEGLSVISARASLARCDVALVVIDAAQGLTAQDAHVAGYAAEAGRAVIVAVNKWDLFEDKTERSAGEFAKRLREEWGFLSWAPIQFISAKSGQRVTTLFEMVARAHAAFHRDVPTRDLNRALAEILAHQSPPVRSGRQLQIKYITQVGRRPPAFALFVNDPKLLHFSYERYLLNQLRMRWDFEGTPVRLVLRTKAPPRES